MHDIYSQTFLYFVSTRWLLGLCTKPVCIITDADGPLVSMNKSHSLQLYCNMYARQFKLLAVWLNSVLTLRAPAKLNSRVSRLLHVCVYYKYC